MRSTIASYTADTNGFHTAWYAIGKGYDSEGVRDITSNPVFDKMMRRGFKYDFMLVEYLGRNGENLIDEIPKLFDWMDLHVRPAPPKQFKVCSLRRTDNRFFWVTANGLPRDFILPAPGRCEPGNFAHGNRSEGGTRQHDFSEVANGQLHVAVDS